MTKNRRISPHEWIQDYFSPIVSVLSSADAQAVCGKNNLTFTEMLQPFSKLMADVTVKDPDGNNHAISGLGVTFQDFFKDPSRLVNQKLLSDLVAATTDEPLISRTFGERQVLEAPGFTPWFDTWMKLYIHSIPAMEHEFSRHHVGCLLAVSSSAPNPIEQFRALSEQAHKHQHEKPTAFPLFIAANALKYYVLIHDVYEGNDAKAQELFTQMQSLYGSASCHFLQVNSRNIPTEDSCSSSNPALVDYWLGHSHRFCNVETRREGMGMTVITTAATVNLTVNNTNESPASNREEAPESVKEEMDHPLAVMEKPESPTPTMMSSVTKLCPVTTTNIAVNLTSNDIDRIRILVREFCIKGLIPYVEKQMRILQETITNRKSRSFLSGAKRWFGQNKAGAAAGTSVVYSKEAPELQTRKLGDFYFMMKLYKNAYTCFHTCKKDFYTDEAWNYYSGAAEMSTLSQFMLSDTTKKYPAHYMDDCITKYLQVCQMPEFAVRATLFDALCLKFLGQFQEAANRFIKMTNESKDLRSSLLFEQASYCYLLSSPPSIRKYAFHIILAGYRFSKAGQKKHSSRAYQQGFQVYRDRGWGLSEDHILYNLGHQSLLLKDHATATNLFNELLSMAHPNSNALQQMCHLREFFIVHHMREKEDKKPALITIPKFHMQECVLDLSGVDQTYDELSGHYRKSTWHNLERVIVERIQGQEILHMSRTVQNVFTQVSSNHLKPQVIIGERIRLLFPVQNHFQTTLVMKKVNLLWRFTSVEIQDFITNENDTSDQHLQCVKTEIIDSLTLDKSSRTNVSLSLTVMKPGELFITGIEYGIKAQFPHSESTDYTIRGKQLFNVKGPRLKATKEHKTTISYGSDYRLQMDVLEEQPRLGVDSKLPETIFQGELRHLNLTLHNLGKVPMKNLYLIINHPGLISVGNGKRLTSLFDFPVITDQSLTDVKENGEIVEMPLDFIRIPVSGSGCILPGKSESLSLWMRGPDKLGDNEIQMLYYYENDRMEKKRQQYRLLTVKYVVKVTPSVAVSATRSDHCKFANDLGSAILIHLSNISKEHNNVLDNIYVSQVSLVSHHSKFKAFHSKNESSPVAKADSMSLSFHATRDNFAEQSAVCKFSSIASKDFQGICSGVSAVFGLPQTGLYVFKFKGTATIGKRSCRCLLARWGPRSNHGTGGCSLTTDEAFNKASQF